MNGDYCNICGAGYRCDCNDKPRLIETAPKDGTRLLVFHEPSPMSPGCGLWEFGFWSNLSDGWTDESLYGLFPTHWLPVPPSPL